MTHHLEHVKVWARDRIAVLDFIERFHIASYRYAGNLQICFFALKVICF